MHAYCILRPCWCALGDHLPSSLKQSKTKGIQENVVKNKRHDFGNIISAEITKEELEALKENPLVESIKLTPIRKIFLDGSNPQVRADDAWDIQVEGINLTGKGETVCILDTGVNFDHPDLTGRNLTCTINCLSGSCIENCSIGDDHSHGTHVAGIVGGNGSLIYLKPFYLLWF